MKVTHSLDLPTSAPMSSACRTQTPPRWGSGHAELRRGLRTGPIPPSTNCTQQQLGLGGERPEIQFAALLTARQALLPARQALLPARQALLLALLGMLVALLLCAAPSAQAASPQLLLGVGRADITPVTGVFKVAGRAPARRRSASRSACTPERS